MEVEMKKTLVILLLLVCSVTYAAPSVTLKFLDEYGTPHVANASSPFPVTSSGSSGSSSVASSVTTNVITVNSVSQDIVPIANRKYITIINESGDDIYVNLGSSPATTSNGHKVSAGQGIGIDCDSTVTISVISFGTSSVSVIQGGS